MENLRLPRLERCFCCSLETGSRIIAYIHLVPIVVLFSLAFVTSAYDDYKYYNRTGHEPLDEFAVVFFRDQYELTLIFLILSTSGVLLYGIHKKYPILLEPFIILKATGLLVRAINILTLLIIRIQGRKTLFFFTQLLLGGIQWSMFIVVYNFRRQILSEGPQQMA